MAETLKALERHLSRQRLAGTQPRNTGLQPVRRVFASAAPTLKPAGARERMAHSAGLGGDTRGWAAEEHESEAETSTTGCHTGSPRCPPAQAWGTPQSAQVQVAPGSPHKGQLPAPQRQTRHESRTCLFSRGQQTHVGLSPPHQGLLSARSHLKVPPQGPFPAFPGSALGSPPSRVTNCLPSSGGPWGLGPCPAPFCPLSPQNSAGHSAD